MGCGVLKDEHRAAQLLQAGLDKTMGLETHTPREGADPGCCRCQCPSGDVNVSSQTVPCICSESGCTYADCGSGTAERYSPPQPTTQAILDPPLFPLFHSSCLVG